MELRLRHGTSLLEELCFLVQVDHRLEEGLSDLLIPRNLLKDPVPLIDQGGQLPLDCRGLLLLVASDVALD